MEIVYVDILILTNFIIDYFLLLLTAFLAKNELKRWRILISAAAASLTALVIFAPEQPLIIELCIKLIFSFIIVLIAFGFKNKIRYIKSVLVFYGANALLAGASLVIWSVFNLNSIVVRNGAVYYSISPALLIATTAAAYLAVVIVSKISRSRKAVSEDITVSLRLFSKQIEISALADSGNMLCDMLSGAPVIICDFDKIKPLLNDELKLIFSKKNFEMGFYEQIINSSIANRLRVIPYDSLGDSGIMAAISLDGAIIKCGNKKEEVENMIMAVTHKKIAGGEFDALLNPELAFN